MVLRRGCCSPGETVFMLHMSHLLVPSIFCFSTFLPSLSHPQHSSPILISPPPRPTRPHLSLSLPFLLLSLPSSPLQAMYVASVQLVESLRVTGVTLDLRPMILYLGDPSLDTLPQIRSAKNILCFTFFLIYYPMLCLFPSALSAPSLRLYLSTIFLHYPLLLLSFPSVPLPSLSSFYIPPSSLILLPLLSLHTSSYHLSAFIRDEMSAVSDHVFSVFVDAACDRLKDPKINSCADNTVRTSCRDVLTIPHFKTFKKCRTNI
jgi:hypothetical protein